MTLDALASRISETQGSLETLQQDEQARQQHLEELTRQIEDTEKQHAERQQALTTKAAETQQKVDELENRHAALEEWQQRMQDCHKRLAELPPETLEARNLRNEIEIVMASMRHLLSSKARVVFPPSAPAAAAPPPAAPAPVAMPEVRTGRITGTFTMPDKALREQDRRIEDKIRVNEARLELLEARLRRGEEDEKCQREKIATLKQQLAALAQGGK
jgi:chromosome segregation ATPase